MSGRGYTLRDFAADLTPMIVFLLVFLASKNIYLATGAGIGLSALQIGWSFARKSPIGMLQWAGLGLIAVFGAVMLKRGWMERYVPETIRDVARPMLNVFGYIWSGLMFFTAALNLLLVFTVDPTTWAKFNLIFPPMSIIGLFLVQNVFMRARASGWRRPSDGAAARA